ncbi:MAG: polyphosphate kinase 1 [Treponema sp.]|nr:polyphosphate kinase 1 [Treponema sp.]
MNDAPIRFFNRELSWLEFNNRVLCKGLDKGLPLLERLQFLSIVTSNFDEFFQVRVAAAKGQYYNGVNMEDMSGYTPKDLLDSISKRAHEIIKKQNDCLMLDVLPALAKKGLEYVTPAEYTQRQKDYAQSYFRNEVYPLLTPLRTDTEFFPNIANLTEYTAFLLVPMKGVHATQNGLEGDVTAPRIALVQIPSGLDQVIWLPGEKKNRPFAILSDIITEFGRQLFPGFEVSETLVFKVARDADFAVNEEVRSISDEKETEGFIQEMEKVLLQRKTSYPVQMTCNSTSEKIMQFLMANLELKEKDVYKVSGIIDPGVIELRDADENGELQFEKWEHFYPHDLPEEEPLWDTLKQHDKILHVPYESYQPVIKMISDAADDPDVLAIKMTLYRTGRDSPIISALVRAAENGKQVVVLVELKARFDEERNIAWANVLENAGVTVIYGLENLKVHAKILMVMRREDGSIRRYVHLATGNYNPKTAKLYSDISLFTANPEIANDATAFFNLVTGYSTLQKMNYLAMAPVSLKSRLLTMIDREIERSTEQNPGLIIAKMNSLTHEEVIQALYRASNAGVKVLLNIRGICMLVPGVEGMSENIRVVSIVDRYLEHSRIFYFQNGGSDEIWCSSADWMSRNLDRRIELMFPVMEKEAFHTVKEILDSYFNDTDSAMELNSDGTWTTSEKKSGVSAQEVLYKKYKKLAATKERKLETEFKVRRK